MSHWGQSWTVGEKETCGGGLVENVDFKPVKKQWGVVIMVMNRQKKT